MQLLLNLGPINSIDGSEVKCSDYKTSQFVHKMAKIYPFRGRGFHTTAEWKIGYKVINKQVIVQMSIVNTAF